MGIEPISLRTSWRDVRVSRPGALRPPQAAAAPALAARLLARLSRAPGPMTSPPMALRTAAQPVWQAVSLHRQVTLAPQLHLALAIAPARSLADAPHPGELRQVLRHERIERQVERLLVGERPAIAAHPPAREQIVLRALARAERLETPRMVAPASPARPGRAAPPEVWPAAPDVPMVVQRPPLAAAAASQPTPQPTAHWPAADAPAPAPAQAPQIDVARLTAQVISAIDRRMLAARERLGGG